MKDVDNVKDCTTKGAFCSPSHAQGEKECTGTLYEISWPCPSGGHMGRPDDRVIAIILPISCTIKYIAFWFSIQNCILYFRK